MRARDVRHPEAVLGDPGELPRHIAMISLRARDAGRRTTDRSALRRCVAAAQRSAAVAARRRPWPMNGGIRRTCGRERHSLFAATCHESGVERLVLLGTAPTAHGARHELFTSGRFTTIRRREYSCDRAARQTLPSAGTRHHRSWRELCCSTAGRSGPRGRTTSLSRAQNACASRSRVVHFIACASARSS